MAPSCIEALSSADTSTTSILGMFSALQLQLNGAHVMAVNRVSQGTLLHSLNIASPKREAIRNDVVSKCWPMCPYVAP